MDTEGMKNQSMRICDRCNTPKPATTKEYYRQKRRRDKLDATCKECRKAEYKKRYHSKKIFRRARKILTIDVLLQIDGLIMSGQIKKALSSIESAILIAGPTHGWTKKRCPEEADVDCDDYKWRLKLLQSACEQMAERAKNGNN